VQHPADVARLIAGELVFSRRAGRGVGFVAAELLGVAGPRAGLGADPAADFVLSHLRLAADSNAGLVLRGELIDVGFR